MVYVESLIYSDGNVNASFHHQFEVHDRIPDEDYHGWQNRCMSSGPVFNPFKVFSFKYFQLIKQ